MNDWQTNIKDSQNNKTGGLLELPSLPTDQELADLQTKGFFVATLDRAPVFNKETLMHAAYQSGKFPAYFGFNWDALLDCLSDFSWLENCKGIVLLYQNPNLLREEDPNAHAMFLETCKDAMANLQKADALPLWVLLIQKKSASNL